MAVSSGTTLEIILDELDTAILPGRQPRNERALPSEIGDQASRDVPELRRVVLVNEEDVHPWLISVRLRRERVIATH